MKKVNLAVVGATGLVGRKIIEVLQERNFPIENFYAFASKKSAGKKVKLYDKEYIVEELTEKSFDRDIDIALFSAGASVADKYGKIAASKGVKVVDNSSNFRMHDDIKLVVPEVNPNVIEENDMIIANPNCSTIQSVVALKPLYDDFGIERIVYNTYQAVSGGGKKALEDLENRTALKWKYPIYNNVLPQIDVFTENGYTKEEMKMVDETHKILSDYDIKITATAARVPVENSHSISINVKLKKEFEIEDIFNSLKKGENLVLLDDIKNEIYPIPDISNGNDLVYVGRVRRDFSCENTINMWVVADNIRKGAATNAIEIAELLLKEE